MEVQKIQTIFETVQAQVSNLKKWRSRNPWTRRTFGQGHRRNYSKRIAAQFSSNVSVFSDSVLCPGGKCLDHPDAARMKENERIKDFVESPQYRLYYNITGKPVEFVFEIYVGQTTIEILGCIGRCWKKQTFNRLSSGRGSSSCPCTPISFGGNPTTKNVCCDSA